MGRSQEPLPSEVHSGVLSVRAHGHRPGRDAPGAGFCLCKCWRESFFEFLKDVSLSWPGPGFVLRPLHRDDPELKLDNCQWVPRPVSDSGYQELLQQAALDPDVNRAGPERYLYCLWKSLFRCSECL